MLTTTNEETIVIERVGSYDGECLVNLYVFPERIKYTNYRIRFKYDPKRYSDYIELDMMDNKNQIEYKSKGYITYRKLVNNLEKTIELLKEKYELKAVTESKRPQQFGLYRIFELFKECANRYEYNSVLPKLEKLMETESEARSWIKKENYDQAEQIPFLIYEIAESLEKEVQLFSDYIKKSRKKANNDDYYFSWSENLIDRNYSYAVRVKAPLNTLFTSTEEFVSRVTKDKLEKTSPSKKLEINS